MRVQSSQEQELVQSILRDYEQSSQNRANFESQWQEIAERVIPSESRSFNRNGAESTKGDKRTQFIFDSTASIALGRFSAILDSLLTPRNQIWHKLKASDDALNKSYRVRRWFEDVNRILFKERYSPSANFAAQNQKHYKSLGAYGTGATFIDELYGEKGLRYKNVHLSELFILENHQGLINHVLRYFPLTARQAYEKWGDKIPDKIKSTLSTSPNREFNFIHCVKPREDMDPERMDYKGMKFASYYISVEGEEVLQEGGYGVFPYAASRYEQYDTEVYGRSPAMEVLPSIKTLNEQKKTMLKQGHRAADPVLLGPDDGVLDGMNIKPGSYNAGGVTADGRPLVHTLPTGNFQIAKELMDDERGLINDVFLVSLFQILIETPQMTATEVMERTREKGILIAPTVGRQESEKLGPTIERELDLLARQGKLPEMPPELIEAKGEYTVVYDSPLSRTQKAEEASGFMRTMESALSIVNVTQDPAPLDHFNWDVIIPEVSDIHGVPPSWMRSKEEIDSIRQGRAEAQQAQQAIQAAPGAAALVKAGAVAETANK